MGLYRVRGPSTVDMLLHTHRSRFINVHMHVQHAVQKRETYSRIIDMLGLTARSTGQDMSGKMVN